MNTKKKTNKERQSLFPKWSPPLTYLLSLLLAGNVNGMIDRITISTTEAWQEIGFSSHTPTMQVGFLENPIDKKTPQLQVRGRAWIMRALKKQEIFCERVFFFCFFFSRYRTALPSNLLWMGIWKNAKKEKQLSIKNILQDKQGEQKTLNGHVKVVSHDWCNVVTLALRSYWRWSEMEEQRNTAEDALPFVFYASPTTTKRSRSNMILRWRSWDVKQLVLQERACR